MYTCRYVDKYSCIYICAHIYIYRPLLNSSDSPKKDLRRLRRWKRLKRCRWKGELGMLRWFSKSSGRGGDDGDEMGWDQRIPPKSPVIFRRVTIPVDPFFTPFLGVIRPFIGVWNGRLVYKFHDWLTNPPRSKVPPLRIAKHLRRRSYF